MKQKVSYIITWIIELLLIGVVFLALYHRAYLQAATGVLAIFISFIPAIVKRNYRVTLPWTFEIWLIIALYLHMSGLVFGWYAKYVWWDVMTHLLGSAIVAMLGFLIVFALYSAGKIHVTLGMMAIFTFFFAVAVGGLWEIAEFGADELFGKTNQPSLLDTNFDLINDTLAAIIVAIFGMHYLKRLPEAKVEHNIEKLLSRFKSQ